MGESAQSLDVPDLFVDHEAARRRVPWTRGAAAGSRTILWVAGAGALAYTSWPLAFLVNRPLAGSALASSFEGRSQPFAWLFILFDCLAGLCMGIVCIGIARVHELSLRRRALRTTLRASGVLVFALLAYGVFGIATAVDAVVPLDCGPASDQACASQLWPLTPDDVLTGTAVLALFAAAVTVVVHLVHTGPPASRSRLPVAISATLVAWSVLGLIVLMWSSAAVMAAVCQYAFLTLTGVLLFLVPLGAVTPASWSATPARRAL